MDAISADEAGLQSSIDSANGTITDDQGQIDSLNSSNASLSSDIDDLNNQADQLNT